MYSTDASLYRVPPQVVVRPRDVDELVAAVEVARSSRTPLTMRGAGTSIAGNAVGPGIVVDTARHLHKIHEVDPAARTARVEPGVVHASLQRAATPHALRFGPDPSTHTRCTIGGMIGNNACGSRALGYGRTSDNVVALDVLTGTGQRLLLGEGAAGVPELDALVDAHLATVRTEMGRFGRQVSGYSLEHLLPENGRRLDRFLVGSEGTLAVVLGATVRLVEDAPHRALAVLGYPSMPAAADAVPTLLHHPLVACEGLGQRIVDVVRARRGTVPPLPRGEGWLFAEVTGATRAEAEALAAAVVADSGALDARVVSDPREAAALWRIREDGAGLAAISLDRPAHAGWEDAAVPPDRLGAYLRDFEDLLRTSGLDGVPYGHFGDGCVHVRIDFELADPAGRGRFREFLGDAARLVASYGGTLSGEHGDGRARSELLPLMYSAEVIDLFARVKGVLDPAGVLNPGVLVDPRPVDADLRLATPLRSVPRALQWAHDNGSVAAAVHRCTGVGKCLAAPTGSVMCPSYQATREEKDSTRGRARVLQEMVEGSVVTGGWASPEVHEALDLCLACKGCAHDCPTGVDMATWKVEALHQRYRGKLRPRGHYALGALPRWLRLGAPVAPLAARALEVPLVQWLAKAVAGVDQRRGLPVPAAEPFRGRSRRTTYDLDDEQPDVAIWADTFTDRFDPAGAQAAVRVLEAAGLRVGVVGARACCGLTWFSTGQLGAARREMERTVAVLGEYAERGVPVVALEPSCLATLRSDAVELLGADTELGRAAAAVARNTRTLAEQLEATPGWVPPDLTGTEVLVQPHCHHASILGWEADARVLARTGARVTRVDGCCGLAGNWGVEQGHHDVSVAVAETHLLPAVRAAAPGTVLLADGFSCRTQLDDLAGVRASHLAELLGQVPTGPAAAPTHTASGPGPF
ncbi:FAD-binding and (Fe-S)-binding domain-containing protein [Nocardioides mesophilus]|uniref:FAD-binding oxidoreductase n=1 Tax=Nocardioides mesophilus TaxID=433659 RepID=A0A7G9RHE2_9ACTN|nr:FAD-binding and (Fe-S)-binding domain-containing protein [Nocardioides mesophilus]QNN55017.1 FAD-binding oxidoreductase [Nocardioides mesophilus]